MTGTTQPAISIRTILAFIAEITGIAIIVAVGWDSPLLYVGIVLVAVSAYPILLQEKSRRNMIIFSTIIIVGTVAGMFRMQYRMTQLDEHPAITTAVVTDTGTTSRKVRGGERWIEYRYTVDGTSYTARERATLYAPGDTIQIRYATTDPSISRPVRPDNTP